MLRAWLNKFDAGKKSINSLSSISKCVMHPDKANEIARQLAKQNKKNEENYKRIAKQQQEERRAKEKAKREWEREEFASDVKEWVESKKERRRQNRELKSQGYSRRERSILISKEVSVNYFLWPFLLVGPLFLFLGGYIFSQIDAFHAQLGIEGEVAYWIWGTLLLMLTLYKPRIGVNIFSMLGSAALGASVIALFIQVVLRGTFGEDGTVNAALILFVASALFFTMGGLSYWYNTYLQKQIVKRHALGASGQNQMVKGNALGSPRQSKMEKKPAYQRSLHAKHTASTSKDGNFDHNSDDRLGNVKMYLVASLLFLGLAFGFFVLLFEGMGNVMASDERVIPYSLGVVLVLIVVSYVLPSVGYLISRLIGVGLVFAIMLLLFLHVINTFLIEDVSFNSRFLFLLLAPLLVMGWAEFISFFSEVRKHR